MNTYLIKYYTGTEQDMYPVNLYQDTIHAQTPFEATTLFFRDRRSSIPETQILFKVPVIYSIDVV